MYKLLVELGPSIILKNSFGRSLFDRVVLVKTINENKKKVSSEQAKGPCELNFSLQPHLTKLTELSHFKADFDGIKEKSCLLN